MTGPINLMQGILAQYKQKLDKVDNERQLIGEILKEITNVSFSNKELELSNNILFIHTHPAKRQIIMFQKNEILSRIQEIEEFKKILDIK